ncbi:Acyl-CoA N-acyltransferase with RING/FYVE/PHD-type zinc finger domain-containing protein [Thalictrum thalictroides]|uniref:Acyl-CoA N-acyltransferase with RING/FYVE/PHD-type zinc finger domain-containing protein n=1 Tax=Thalictrum thalictroides TaxID=46969 RepID=A0A7J6W9M8_THATH|nr:Acyl-CoA N-acyltransferase with RING/FYVE/PHD-type zinc finger domain-containing protein [Thalictrum thalictroides]
MGEEVVCLTISSDGNTMDDKCFRAVKRPHECIVDNTEAANPNKKPAIEPLIDENPGRAESSECDVDSIEVEISNKNPEEESFNNENSFKVESRCLHECVVDAIAEVDTPNNKLALDDKKFSRVESNCLNECVVGSMEIETLNKNLAEEISNNEICSRTESNHSDECVVDALEVETPNKKTGQEFSNDESSCILESKCLSECAVDAMEVQTPNKRAVQEVSVDDNYSKIDSKCLNECFVDDMGVYSHNKKPEEDFSDDDNSSRLEFNCSNECVVDGIEVDTPNKKSAVEISNNESSSRVEFKNLDKCDVDAHERDTPNKKLQQEVRTDENSSRLEQKSLDECVLDAIEVDIPSKKLEESFSKVESKCSNECLLDTTEVEPSNENLDEEIPNDRNYTQVESKCLNECIADASKVETCSKNLEEEISNDCNSSRVESKCLNECVLDAIEVETSDKNTDKVLLNNENSLRAELQCSNECFRDTIDVNKKPSAEVSSDENLFRLEPKYSNEFIVDAIEAETPIKHPVKESSTESSSEILNPNGSPHKNASSSQSVSSQHGEGLSKSGSWDITSSNPVESCAEITGKEGHCMKGVSCSLSKKEVVVEGSKDGNTSGVKRIIFKFSKSRYINNGVYPSSTQPSCMEVDYGFSDSRLNGERPLKMLGTSEDLFESTSGTKPYPYASKKNNEPKMFDGILENYTQNVKKLLSTGILEGVEVNYVNQEKKLLRGIIKDYGYLCGCALCNFSKVLNAYEFEQHAGCKTKHPNDHVILDNGKSIYSIIQELKNVSVSSLEDVIRALVGPLFNEKSYLKWKESLETGCFQRTKRMGEKAEQSQQSHLNLVDFPQSTMSFSCSSEDTEDSLGSAPRPMMQKFPVKQRISTMQGISKERKRAPKKLSMSPKNPVGRNKKRDNDLHRVLFMPNGLPDGTELAYFAKGKRVLDGYKQGHGIVCSCCDSEISPSQFEAHAGCAAKRQPYRHIYTSTGVSLHDLSLSLVNGHCLAISNTGNVCTVCGDGGDLIFCDACSQSFHADCLDSQCAPEGNLCCPYCKDKIGIPGKVASSESSGNVRPITIRLTRVVKAPATEIGGCVVCRAPDFSVMTFDERTVIICDQCEKEYHVGCLKERGLSDLKELPKGKWFCCEHCSRIHATLHNLIFTGVKVIPPSMSNIIRRKLIEKGLTTEVAEDVEWQLLSGKFGPLEKRSLLSRAVSIFRDSFDPIVERSGRDLIPAMVYGKNVAGQEFGGLYCALISVKLLFFLNVEKLVLPAAEEAESIWTNKFGFKKMSEDQFHKYTKDVQLISFKGTIMLEKAVSRG